MPRCCCKICTGSLPCSPAACGSPIFPPADAYVPMVHFTPLPWITQAVGKIIVTSEDWLLWDACHQPGCCCLSVKRRTQLPPPPPFPLLLGGSFSIGSSHCSNPQVFLQGPELQCQAAADLPSLFCRCWVWLSGKALRSCCAHHHSLCGYVLGPTGPIGCIPGST